MSLIVASGMDYLCGHCGGVLPSGLSVIGDENVGVVAYTSDLAVVHSCGDTAGLDVPT